MKLKILSWNIWAGTYLDGVIEFLKNIDADIIALQEVVEDDRRNIIEIIAKKLGYEYAHAVDMNMPLKFLPGQKSDDKRTIKYGNAILSKYKITNSNIYELSKVKEFRRLIIEVDIKIEDKTLHVFSVHLKHNHQKPSEIQDLEAENLLKLLSEKNTIVMGDFNALPEDTTIKKMSKTLINTEKNSATPTWSVYKEGCTGCLVEDIKYKLDYIFTSKDIKSDFFKVYESKSSDHLPISAEIEI
ncbi:MAG: endonuclease/exonuclease/phosphatase family protein [Patescibacteria group bacterium]